MADRDFMIARAFDADGAATLDPRKSSTRRRRVLPGFGLWLGFTIAYLSLIVLIPLSAAFIKTATLSWAEFWTIVTAPRVVATYRLTFGAAFARRDDQRGVRPARRVGAGPLSVSRDGAWSTRSSTCPSRCRRRSPASR